MRVLAGIFRKETSEVREEQPKHGKVIETNHDEEAIDTAKNHHGMEDVHRL